MYILPPEALAKSSGVCARVHTRTHALDLLNTLQALVSTLLRFPPQISQPATNLMK